MRDSGASNNIIATIAIGDDYYNNWLDFAYPTWKKYCDRFDLGLVVFDQNLLSRNDTFWKKATWQKLLIGKVIKNELPSVENVCYLDTDILINPMAPNVFDDFDPKTIGLVSLRKNLPYPPENVLRRIAFFRNKYYDEKYPLDSALFISVRDLYEYHKLPEQGDIACAGMFVFNIDTYADWMKEFFYKYSRDITSITNNGDQTHFNYEVLANADVSWLDYRFQAIWTYEMAWKFPFLYHYGRKDKTLIKQCVEASLFSNYFLHFAGSWFESDMWKVDGIMAEKETLQQFEEYNIYLKMPVIGKPVGTIKPRRDESVSA